MTPYLFKPCFKCGETKPLTSYYRHAQMLDGHLNKCKVCTRRDSRAARASRLEHYLDYDRRRANKPERVLARKAYKKTLAGQRAFREANGRWLERNPHKRAAHNKVWRALRSGRLTRKPCEVCGAKAQAHHPNYSSPLDVVWLCPLHHAREHQRMRSA